MRELDFGGGLYYRRAVGAGDVAVNAERRLVRRIVLNRLIGNCHG